MNSKFIWSWLAVVILVLSACSENKDLTMNDYLSRNAECCLNEMLALDEEDWMNGIRVDVASTVNVDDGCVNGIAETFVLTYDPLLKVQARATDKKSSDKSSDKKTTKKKKKTVVRTTVKCTDYSEFSRMAAQMKQICPTEYLLAIADMNRDILKGGGQVRFKVTMLFDGLMMNQLNNAIQVPP